MNNTDASDTASRDALKSRAMSMSGADVDFWVDSIIRSGGPLVEARSIPRRPVVCIPVRTKMSGWRRKPTLSGTTAEVLLDAPAPVLVIGPETDVSSGLGMTEILVALDGSAASEQILPIAVEWAKTLKLRIVLAGVVRDGAGGQETHPAETGYLRGHLAKVAREIPDASFELVEAVDPATGLCARLAEQPGMTIAP